MNGLTCLEQRWVARRSQYICFRLLTLLLPVRQTPPRKDFYSSSELIEQI